MATSLNSTQKVFIAVTSTWLVLSFAANLCIVVVISRMKKMRTVTNMFLGNLALTDLILVAFALPLQLHDVTHSNNYYETSTECRVVMSLPLVCITCSIYTMVALAEERYRAIVLQPPRVMTTRVAMTTIFFAWCLALVVGMTTFVQYDTRTALRDNVTLNVCTDVLPYAFRLAQGVVVLCVSYIIPQIFLAHRYVHLVRFLWYQGHTVGVATLQSVPVPTSMVVSSHRSRSVKLLISIAVLFCVAWLPYFAMKTAQIALGHTDSLAFGHGIHMATMSMALFSTSYNFVVYMKYSLTFRTEFLRQLRLRPADIVPFVASQ